MGPCAPHCPEVHCLLRIIRSSFNRLPFIGSSCSRNPNTASGTIIWGLARCYWLKLSTDNRAFTVVESYTIEILLGKLPTIADRRLLLYWPSYLGLIFLAEWNTFSFATPGASFPGSLRGAGSIPQIGQEYSGDPTRIPGRWE